MARVNINILGISELKWTGMGEFNSDDHYIYYCGQESLRRNRVAVIVNERVQKAVLGCNLKTGAAATDVGATALGGVAAADPRVGAGPGPQSVSLQPLQVPVPHSLKIAIHLQVQIGAKNQVQVLVGLQISLAVQIQV